MKSPLSSSAKFKTGLFFKPVLAAATLTLLALMMGDVHSTGGGTPPVDPAVQSAFSTILGDLQQEIVDGSTITSPSTGVTLYTPKFSTASARSTAIPALSGFTPAISSGYETDGLANLLKRSAYSIPFYSRTVNSNYAANGANRATQINSTTNPSRDGHAITIARWNEHLLLGRAHTGSPTDTTPTANFTPPDWIAVAQNGLNPTTWSSSLVDTGNNPVTKRYAYAIYDEGGLLDMNVAGYPSGLTPAQTSYKSLQAFTDLTQLGLSQNQIDQIVGWRNYATAQPSGTFPNYTFDPAAATRYYNAVLSNTTGFLTPNSATFNGSTDQLFTSRQQLLSLTQSLSISPDVLQYLTTFSRSLEQPLVSPDPNRPHIINPATPPPPVGGPTGANEDAYLGNNDAAGNDDAVNPSFLNIRVSSSFTRLNGTQAVLGDPLVKTKFALSNLAMVAYNATNSSLPAAFHATTSDPDPIYDHFGLSRSNPSSPWVYNHGQNFIMTLAQVATANREPDFAELLKASITVGSLAKGGPNLRVLDLNNYQYTLDTTVDYQVLQIMTNLIDQQDADSYPTVIQIASGPGGLTKIYGTEDLPYFYRFHLLSVVDQLPSPLCAANDSINFQPLFAGDTSTGTTSTARNYPSGTTTTNSWTINNTYSVLLNRAKRGTLTNPGEATYLYVADLWNPHDPNTVATSSGKRPIQFRIIAETNSPMGTNGWLIGAETIPNGSGNVAPNPTGTNPTGFPGPNPGTSSFTTIFPEANSSKSIYNWPISSIASLTAANTALIFSDNGGLLFREPTLLWNTNPSGISLSYAGTSPNMGTATDANTGKTYYGITIGKAPVSQQISIHTTSASPPSTDGTYVIQSSSLSTLANIPAGAFQQITFSLQYLDVFGNWVTYDLKYPDLHGLNSPNLVTNSADYPNNSWENPLRNGQFSTPASSLDPRTARWGINTSSNLGQNESTSSTNRGVYTLENATVSSFNDNSSIGNTTIGNSNFTVLESQRPRADLCNQTNYSLPCSTSDPGKNKFMRWFSGTGYNAAGGNGDIDSPLFYSGLLSQNLPRITLRAKDNVTTANLYVEDPDGVARPAMGAYAYAPVVADILTTQDSSQDSRATTSPHRIGLPMATASTYAGTNGLGVATSQSQSRPLILNRPFRSVSEMSYTFTGTPWKNIDFFTPSSGDSALLDTFCVNEPPPTGLVAGKVNLNTRQAPVLQALVAGAYRDELANTSTPPSYALPALTAAEASNVAAKLVGITTASDTWRGPLANVGSLSGHFVANPGTTSAGSIGTDWYTYAPPVYANAPVSPALASSYTYAGLSAVLDSSVYSASAGTSATAASTPLIQRFRESALRPLADCGQTRVWNLLIDVISQTGSYPSTSTSLAQFQVNGERHYWQHVAIDRYTGQILDQSIEEVAETPEDIAVTNLTAEPGTESGTTIGSFNALPGGTFTYTLVSGPGSDDNAYFTIVGNTLQTIANLNVSGKTSYTILVQVTGSNGQSYQQSFTITIGPIGTQDTPTLPLWALISMTLLFLGVGSRFLLANSWVPSPVRRNP